MTTAAPTQLLTVKEVAEWLRIDPHTLYRWTAEGRIPHIRCGGVRFDRAAIEAWIAARSVKP